MTTDLVKKIFSEARRDTLKFDRAIDFITSRVGWDEHKSDDFKGMLYHEDFKNWKKKMEIRFPKKG